MTMAGAVLAAGVWAGAALAAAAAPPTGASWSATLDADLGAADAALRDSHPGLHDARAPGFAGQLHDTLALARRRAPQVDSFAGYWWALKGYAAAFNDGHVSLNALPGAPALPVRWPGFLTGFEGDAQIVMERAAGSTQTPTLGARLLSCDGVDAATLAAQRVGDFTGRWNLQASRIHAGGEVLLDQGNPFIALPRRCRFLVDGQARDITLQWRPLDSADVATHLAATRRSFRPPNGLHVLPGGGYWITTSSFNADPGQPNVAELTALLQTLDTQREALQGAPLVVLDVRGNSGGASHWSIALARLVWGAEAVARVHDDSFVEWRTSQANIDRLRGFLQRLNNAPDAAPDMVRMLETVTDGMAQARADGQALWRQPAAAPAPPPVMPPAAATARNPAQKVFVVADAACGSACLDALDLWKRLGALQVGVPTSADSLYMDIRPERLPSGLARLSVPMKVYRGRPRGSNVPHLPDLPYSGDMRDSPALQAWLLAR